MLYDLLFFTGTSFGIANWKWIHMCNYYENFMCCRNVSGERWLWGGGKILNGRRDLWCRHIYLLIQFLLSNNTCRILQKLPACWNNQLCSISVWLSVHQFVYLSSRQSVGVMSYRQYWTIFCSLKYGAQIQGNCYRCHVFKYERWFLWVFSLFWFGYKCLLEIMFLFGSHIGFEGLLVKGDTVQAYWIDWL